MVIYLRTPRTYSARPRGNRSFSGRTEVERIVFNDEDYRYVWEPFLTWYEDFEMIDEPFFSSEDYGDLT